MPDSRRFRSARSIAARTVVLTLAVHGTARADEAPPGPPRPPASAPSTPSDPPSSPPASSATPDDLARWAEAATYSEARGGTALLVQKNGRIVFERYANGGGADVPHGLASGTKSFWGVAAMAAVEDGLLSLDEKASDTLTEWRDDPRKARITARHLLSLSSGLAPSAQALQAPTTPDKYAFALGVAAIDEPGSTFRYGPAAYFAFGALLDRKLAAAKEDPLAYLTRRVLDPIGLKIGTWMRDAAGHPTLPHGAAITAREWAKFGEFVREGGTVAGKRVLAQELLDRCFESSAANPAYGLTWWLPGRGGVAPNGQPFPAPAVHLPKDVFLAEGLGKQILLVCRSRGLVVVRQGMTLRGFDDAKFQALVLGLPPATPAERARAFVAKFDRNADGVLADDEVPAPLLPAFASIDANHDGRLDVAELEARFDTGTR